MRGQKKSEGQLICILAQEISLAVSKSLCLGLRGKNYIYKVKAEQADFFISKDAGHLYLQFKLQMTM